MTYLSTITADGARVVLNLDHVEALVIEDAAVVVELPSRAYRLTAAANGATNGDELAHGIATAAADGPARQDLTRLVDAADQLIDAAHNLGITGPAAARFLEHVRTLTNATATARRYTLPTTTTDTTEA